MTLFPLAIIRARQAAGLTQKELAEQLGISAQYLNDMERGRRQPGRIPQLAAALTIPPDVLYYLAGELPPDVQHLTMDHDCIRGAWAAFRSALVAPVDRT